MNFCSLTPDKFGFYQVGPHRTYSKFEAFELQKRTGHFPEWNFNREVLAQVNWQQEPPGELWDYYRARARQIRESYDYCVIFYSGGSDSHNLLSAWLDEGCHVDEIASYCYFEGGGRDAFMNNEVDRVALPLINELSKTHNFRYRLIDISQDVASLGSYYGDEWPYLCNFSWTLNTKSLTRWRETIADYQTIINSGKKLCFVWGADKPKIFYDGRLYLQFIDIVDNCISPYTQKNYHNGYYDELFYWNPDMPELMVKQAHVVKKFVETVNDPTFYAPAGQKDTHGLAYNRVLGRTLSSWGLKQVIYPRWDPATFVAGKSSNRIHSNRDHWYIYSNLESADRYNQMIKSHLTSVDPWWFNDPTNYLKGIKGNVSPKYYLE